MPLITLSMRHEHTLDEARRRLETVVHEITSRFGTLRLCHHTAERDCPTHLSAHTAEGPWERLEGTQVIPGSLCLAP
jgi:hypothetical protein